jgi:uncharacterized protein (TIGR03435 family)
MKRALISASLGVALLWGAAAAAVGQAGSTRQQARRPASASNAIAYQVHISATTMKAGSTSIEMGSDRWSARGYDLKTLIAQIYDVDVRRVDLAADGDQDPRYDLTASLPGDVGRDEMQRLLVAAVEQKFSLDVKPEIRSMMVYVMTAPNGPGSGLHLHAPAAHPERLAKPMALEIGTGSLEDVGEIQFEGRNCSGVSSGGITASAETIDDFSRTLEGDLDRVLIDETNLAGTYDFQIGTYANKDELFQLLRDQLGLVVRPAERKVTVLRVRPHGEFARLAAGTVPAA